MFEASRFLSLNWKLTDMTLQFFRLLKSNAGSMCSSAAHKNVNDSCQGVKKSKCNNSTADAAENVFYIKLKIECWPYNQRSNGMVYLEDHEFPSILCCDNTVLMIWLGFGTKTTWLALFFFGTNTAEDVWRSCVLHCRHKYGWRCLDISSKNI